MYNFIYYKDDGKIRKPWFFENSKLPIILSYLAPIDIYAITFGPFVWCRGVMDEETRIRAFEISKIAFQQKRKKVRTSLKSIISEDSLVELGIDPNNRASNLTPENYYDIAKDIL